MAIDELGRGAVTNARPAQRPGWAEREAEAMAALDLKESA